MGAASAYEKPSRSMRRDDKGDAPAQPARSRAGDDETVRGQERSSMATPRARCEAQLNSSTAAVQSAGARRRSCPAERPPGGSPASRPRATDEPRRQKEHGAD